MPIPSSLSSKRFNIGQNLSVVIQSNGGPSFPLQNLGHLAEFDYESVESEIGVITISTGGRGMYDSIPHGVAGTIQLVRYAGNFEKLYAAVMQRSFDNGAMIRWAIGITVVNPDGSTDTGTIQDCAFSKWKLGKYAPDKEVMQGVSFRGSLLQNSGAPSQLLAQ